MTRLKGPTRLTRSNWRGEFTDGETAILHSVIATFDGQFLILRDETGREVTRWDTRDISIEATRKKETFQLRSTAAPGASLELTGESLIEELGEIGIAWRGLPQQSSHRIAFGVGLAVGIVGLVGLVWTLITPLSRALADLVPLEIEQKLSGRMEQVLADQHCESDDARIVMDKLVVRLAGPDHQLPPIHAINIDMPNAFALPGGSIVLTRGLLEAAERPAEVAGILAHEIQHVRQRHVMTAMIRGTILTSLWSITLGDYSGLLVIDPTTAFQIATLQFSREAEASADRGAIEMLDAADLSSDGLTTFFNRLAETEGSVPEWLSTHPASSERAEASTLSSNVPIEVHEPALGPDEWATLANACADAGPPELNLKDLFFGSQ